MPPRAYLIDTNLLILLVVGSEDRDLIQKHRRLKGYSESDYDNLKELLEPAPQVIVTPNTLTEASNLLGQHGEPERSVILERLRFIIDESQELTIASARAAQNMEFKTLGLTDSVLYEIASEDTPLITVDLGLYLAVLVKVGESAAVDFTEYRTWQ